MYGRSLRNLRVKLTAHVAQSVLHPNKLEQYFIMDCFISLFYMTLINGNIGIYLHLSKYKMQISFVFCFPEIRRSMNSFSRMMAELVFSLFHVSKNLSKLKGPGSCTFMCLNQRECNLNVLLLLFMTCSKYV